MSKKKRRKGGSQKKQRQSQVLPKRILQFLEVNAGNMYSFKQLARKLQLKNKQDKKELHDALESLQERDQIILTPQGGIKSARSTEEYSGVIDHISPRYGFIESQDLEDDVYVSNRNMGTALDGDTVKFIITKKTGKGRMEGRVLEIIQRSKADYVGRLDKSSKHAFVIPDNKKLHVDFYIDAAKEVSAKHNDKVIVKFISWPEGERNPIAEIVDVLGPSGDNTAEMHSIMAEFGLPYKFPPEVLSEAKKIPGEISDAEVKKRRDFREVTTFTIDPHDAKDFDDAISYRELDGGLIEIGVHIADVTHYVKPGNVVDEEGFNRATSVYLVDRTIPMLPERLSNELCSLRPKEDKLTFAAVFEMDKQGVVKKQWFGRTVIHSDRRFTYEEAQERLESGEGDLAAELGKLNELAKILRKQRFQSGAVNFETVEVKFRLDEAGKPLGIMTKERKDAHKLIEEFMLLANRRVATYVYNMREGKKEKPFVYRTHDTPDPEKVDVFARFAKNFGHQVNVQDGKLANSLNNLMEEIEGKPEQNVLMALAIRSMAKAKYTTEPLPHYGLAFEHYTHFTSPIRRYPDMLVHRWLAHYLKKGGDADEEKLEDQCEHSSEMEKRAADAERASIKYKQVEYMQMMGDRNFEGIVSGVTDWGIFVEIIETKCEGLVRIADLLDDFYEFDEKHMRIVGRSNKRMITLGEPVRVRVTKTDIDRRTIDLEFVDADGFRDFT